MRVTDVDVDVQVERTGRQVVGREFVGADLRHLVVCKQDGFGWVEVTGTDR